ncbi:hypothetical protein [Dictyobacter arantiisoli]|uniref:Membrane protein NfeD2 N-terminal transmembrane domain-containing protein n=1 Tax=Dictyobacter arantiisoli TaxID=2014874 RepID=A0A5A5TBS2_9CHLR|nr:hypothetical protein [Dictyobacter arantiisoli]GCF08872.1 hypothetical protein KDI_24360 [Dictyobacter arantiisoli]
MIFDQLSLLFITCFLIGLLYLIVTALFGSIGHSHSLGGDHHGIAHHIHVDGPGHHGTHAGAQHSGGSGRLHLPLLAFLNPTSIVFFLIGFGFFGYAIHITTSFTIPIILALSCVSGIVVAFLLLMLFARIFGNSEAATVQDISDRTGLIGKVSITIQPDGIGEILYLSPGGMRKSIPARSIDGRRLEREQEVVVVNYQNGIADVDTWEHIVNQENALSSLSSESDDLSTLRALLEEPSKNDSAYVMPNDTQKEHL